MAAWTDTMASGLKPSIWGEMPREWGQPEDGGPNLLHPNQKAESSNKFHCESAAFLDDSELLFNRSRRIGP
jgi:hypothetical protein